jgi:alpha-beta hydrolase superfamily lysophospholipase
VAWAHGTVGSADPSAPSRQDDPGVPGLAQLVQAGYVVAAPDFEGLGTPGVHPYLDGGSEGRSVLDAARAAMHLSEAGAGPDVLVWGHSQGGHAALFAAQLAAVHAPELRLLGVAVAAPVTRVTDLVELAGRTPVLGAFYLMAAAGLVAQHPDLDRDQLLSAEGSRLLRHVETECLNALVATVVVHNEPVGSGVPLAGTGWAPFVADEDLGPAPLPVPVLVTQGTQDPLVLPSVTQRVVTTRCGLGDTVELRSYAGADHSTVLDASAADTLGFFAARLRGDPPASTCAG